MTSAPPPQTLFWYDLETFGTHPQHDRIAQFAGLRTDCQFEPVGDPIILYCRIPEDYVPDPLACLVTGITPQKTLKDGLPEYEFIQRILQEFSRPGTCVVGYNNINFDDEFIRSTLYRNLFDPYKREYSSGNSRWDIIDLARAAHDLRPQGISWVTNDKGHPSFRLEMLTKANGIEHDDAHDALADVRATIALAELLYKKQKDLFLYAFKMRRKQRLKNQLHLHSMRPVLHTSSIFTTSQGCTTLISPLTVDPNNSNALICFDLRNDPEQLISANPSSLKTEVPLFRLALNKCPFIAPVSALDDDSARRLQIDKDLCLKHYQRLQERHDIPMKVRTAFSRQQFEIVKDPDFQIYSGGFFSDADRNRFDQLHAAGPASMLQKAQSMHFEDSRIPEMIWRLVARSYPEYLDEEQKKRRARFIATRLLFPPGDIMVDYNFFRRKIREKAMSPDIDARGKRIMKELEAYGKKIEQAYLQDS